MRFFAVVALLFAAAPALAAQVDDRAAIAIAKPQILIVDRSIPAATRTAMLKAADAYYGFWNNGSQKLLDEALAPDFVDNQLPNGRTQGPTGDAYASKQFLAAAPDLRCIVTQRGGHRAVSRPSSDSEREGSQSMSRVLYRCQTVGEVEVFYREAGPVDGPILLLLHGFPSASHMFRDLIPLLADRYRVIAPDLAGFEQTKAPPRGDFDYTFAACGYDADRSKTALAANNRSIPLDRTGGVKLSLGDSKEDLAGAMLAKRFMRQSSVGER